MASNTDLFKKLARRWVGQIGVGGVPDGTTTTIPLSSSTNLPTDTAILVVIDRVDSNGASTPTKEETVIGVVSGTNLVSCIRGSEGTAQAHDAGAVVEILVTAKGLNDFVDGFLVNHTQLGTHKSLLDTNSKNWIGQDATALAVNYLTVGNAVTGSSVTTSMTGTDTHIGYDLRMKGTGKFRKPSLIGLMVFTPPTEVTTGDGAAFFRIPAELDGMNLTGVAMSVATAGTTGTTDIQLRRTRSGSDTDMLSTKLTIDSTETDTVTAGTAAVIDTGNDDVLVGDRIHVDVDATAVTKAKGLYVELRFELP